MSKILKSFMQNERALKKYLGRFLSRSADVDDIAQEAFLKAYVTEVRSEVHSSKALLFRAAKHLALNEIARKANKSTDYTEDLGVLDVLEDRNAFTAEDQLDSKRKLIIFTKAVASLPPNCRKVFLMRKMEGLKVKEIATRLNISVSGVEKHVATGLVKCSQYFREHGYDLSDLGGVAEGTRLNLQVNNLFNNNAPFFDAGQTDNNTPSAYDPNNHTVIGRTVALTLTKAW